MIFLAIVACTANFWCDVVYDGENKYTDMEACQLRVEELLEDILMVDGTRANLVCIDWKGKDTAKLRRYVRSIYGYHKTEKA